MRDELDLREVRSADFDRLITEHIEIVEDSERRLLLRATTGLPTRWPDVMMFTGVAFALTFVGLPVGAPLTVIGSKHRRRHARKSSVIVLEALCDVGSGSGYRTGCLSEVQLRDRNVPIELIRRITIFYNEICIVTEGELISVFPPYYGQRRDIETQALSLARRCGVELGYFGEGPLYNRRKR